MLYQRLEDSIYYCPLGSKVTLDEAMQRRLAIGESLARNKEDEHVIIYSFSEINLVKESDYVEAKFSEIMAKTKHVYHNHVIYIQLGLWYKMVLGAVHKLYPSTGANVYHVDSFDEALELARKILAAADSASA